MVCKLHRNIEKKIPKGDTTYTYYLNNINVNKSSYLSIAHPYEIFDIIKSFDLNKSLGPNSIPVYLLKICNDYFSKILAKLLNLSFATGIFPDLCKFAKVIPIFKKDNPLLCNNYRPISLLPIFSKIFEKIIYSRMYNFIDKNNLLYEKQFGFRSNHSTSHALISLIESIKNCLDDKKIVGGVFIDLAKAFDTVNHEILCNKLSYYGFRGKFNDLLKSFLSDRKQYVSINGVDSEYLDINCGVPQGSTLGPLLFILYINDLNYSLKYSTASHFADDTCLLYASKNPKTLETNLNYDLKRLNQWLYANRLSLNIDKSKLLLFHSKYNKKKFDINIKMKGIKLTPSSSVKYLGLYLDDNLSWDYHINELTRKLSRTNGILSKLRHFVPIQTLLQIYYSLFYSHMSYGILVWSLTAQKNIEKITLLQKKCLRILNFSGFIEHTNPLFIKNKIVKFSDIIKMNQLLLANQFYNDVLPGDLRNLLIHSSNVHTHHTRISNSAFFIPSIASTNYGTYSLKYQVPLIWNEFSKAYSDKCESSYKVLKKFLINFFIDKYKDELKIQI